MSAGEVGKCGAAVDSLEDMEILFDGLPLDKVTTSMTITSTAALAWAMYIAVCEKMAVPYSQIGGTVQNDIPIVQDIGAECGEIGLRHSGRCERGIRT